MGSEWHNARCNKDTYALLCHWAGEYKLSVAKVLAAMVQCFDEFQDATGGEFDFWLYEAGYVETLRDGVQYPFYHRKEELERGLK